MLLAYPRPGGGSVWLSSSAAPVCLPDGAIAGVVCTYTDITQLRQLQKEHELVVHMISHDLRNPLSVISNRAYLLRTLLDVECPTERVLSSVAAIDRSARRMTSMIEDMVDAARVEGGALVLQREPVDLAKHLRELLDHNARVIDVARIRCEVPPDLPRVSADPARLERVFLNLLSNALKYSLGDALVIVRARAVDEMVEVTVTDQGPGVPPEELPHLFERFYRVPHSGARTEGLGLGLFITRRLVEEHGGRTWVESAVGKGSTFAFTLPASAS
jgi:signal transduction histidine kinase